MTPSPSHQPSDFDRFRDLTRRILTTPKSELVKDQPKKKPAAKKRKG
jgi:hypothetical protein